MSSSKATANASGIGFVSLLTIAFIVLKLTGVIAWDWVWILSPLWISFGLWLLVMVALIIGAVIFINRSDKNG